MRPCDTKRARSLRLAPLAAAFALLFDLHAGADIPVAAALTTAPTAAPAFAIAMPADWRPGDRTGVAALQHALRTVGLKSRAAGTQTAVLPVTSCADDSAGNTLRAVVATAAGGDTIDLSGLSCSVITLTQGAIPIDLDNLLLTGPGATILAIDGAGTDRVFVHYGDGTFRLQGLTVRNGANRVTGYNVAGGACILSGGFVTLDNSTVSGCVASGEGAYGGGILADGLTMYTSTLSGNVALGSESATFTAAYGGGAFAYDGSAALFDSTVSGNRATFNPTDTFGSYDTGGGIFVDQGGSAYRSTIEGNYSFGTGGGIASHAGFNIVDSTISGNTAKAKSGGGLFVRSSDNMSVSNSTIAFNTALRGGGLYLSGSPRATVLQSSIVADNVAASGADVAAKSALTISGANNLVLVADTDVGLPADTLQANPKLLPLAENGGPTRTQALQAASPAIGSGNNVANLTTDQRGPGFPRVLGVMADIGALEVTPAAQLPRQVPAASAGLLALLAGLLGILGMGRTAKRR